MRKNKLPEDVFNTLVKYGILNSIDLNVINNEGKVLLGLRKDEPAKNYWFVPGGRIYKGEVEEQALKEIIKNELNLDYKNLNEKNKIYFHQYADHIYPTNKSEDPEYGTHYRVHAYTIEANPNLNNLPMDQHKEWRYFTTEELLADITVHQNTKDYFLHPNIQPDTRLYGALMSHYIHYDKQMWSRTQLLIAIQVALLAAGYSTQSMHLGWIVMCGSAILTSCVWILMNRDRQNRDVNLPIMDRIIAGIHNSQTNPRLVSVRSETSGKKGIRGVTILNWAFGSFILIDLILAIIYLIKASLS